MTAVVLKLSPAFWEEKRCKVDNHRLRKKNILSRNHIEALFNPTLVLNHAQMVDSHLQWLGFSSQFPRHQAAHLVSTPTEESRRRAWNILMNELGVSIHRNSGEVEGNRCSYKGYHITWLEKAAAQLGIDTELKDYLARASNATKRFDLIFGDTYGSSDSFVSQGAEEAIEGWAAYGILEEEKDRITSDWLFAAPLDDLRERIGKFWVKNGFINFWTAEIIAVRLHNEVYRVPAGLEPIDLIFYIYHRNLEVGHDANAKAAFEDVARLDTFKEDAFLHGGMTSQDGQQIWFEGREEGRVRLA